MKNIDMEVTYNLTLGVSVPYDEDTDEHVDLVFEKSEVICNDIKSKFGDDIIDLFEIRFISKKKEY